MGTTGKHLGKMVNPKNDQWRGTIVSQTLDQGNRLRLQENCLFNNQVHELGGNPQETL